MQGVPTVGGGGLNSGTRKKGREYEKGFSLCRDMVYYYKGFSCIHDEGSALVKGFNIEKRRDWNCFYYYYYK